MELREFCPKCGVVVPANAPAGLCPRCLLGGALEPPPDPGNEWALISPNLSAATGETDIEVTEIRFGNYILLSSIGRGGNGIVWRARQLNPDRIVAVKMLLFGKLASPDEIARFKDEAQVTASLKHPNIVQIYEVGEIEGQHFFSMEYHNHPVITATASTG